WCNVAACSPCSEAAGVVTCELGSLGPGASDFIDIRVLAPAVAGPITNSAVVTSAGDAFPDDDAASVTTSVVTLAPLPGAHDIAVLDLRKMTDRWLTDTPTACESNPSLSVDGRFVVYDRLYNDFFGTHNEGLFITEIATGATRMLEGATAIGNDGVYAPN